MRQFLSSLFVGMLAAFSEIRTQPLRSLLSMLGVGLAVGALTALLCIIGGLKGFMRDTVAEMGGPGRIAVRSMSASTPAEALQFSRSGGLQRSDGPRLSSDMKGALRAMNAAGLWSTASFGGVQTRMYLLGMDREYLETILKVNIVEGRAPTREEFERGDPVALLGWTIADRLEPQAKAHGTTLVGSTILVSGVRYKVLGRFTMERGPGWRHGISAFVPFKAAERFHLGAAGTLDALQLQLADPESSEVLLPRITALLKSYHRGAEDFSFQLFDFIKEFQTMVNNIALLFSFVAVLSLGVGALGIFNVMLSSLHDRVREVGVRKALGARPLQIGVQFLAESVTLSVLGGLGGLLLGAFPVLLGDALQQAFHFRPVLDVTAALQALGVAVATGVLAGLVPAWKAMRLDPIEALRYE